MREVLRTPGEPLPEAPRRALERSFGQDLSHVRVHADEAAGRSAADVGALAYAVGPHVAFAPGRYAPHGAEGLRLLAHEVAHVARAAPPASDLVVGSPQDAAERAADAAASRALAGAPASLDPAPAPGVLRRQAVPEPEEARRALPPGRPLPYREAVEERAREQMRPSPQQPPAPRAPAPRTAQPGTAGRHRGTRYVVYENEVRVGGSWAWRNNNPGNMVRSPFARAHGAIGDDGTRAIFPDEATGLAAVVALLGTATYGALTVEGAMHRFAPPHENDSAAYVVFIRRRTGLDPAALVRDLTDEQRGRMARAIQVYEGWLPGTTHRCGEAAAPAWALVLLGCATP